MLLQKYLLCFDTPPKVAHLLGFELNIAALPVNQSPKHSTNSINNSRQKEDKAIYYLPACCEFSIELCVLAAHWHSSNTYVKGGETAGGVRLCASSIGYCVATLTKLSVDFLFCLWLRFVDPEIFDVSQFLGSC